MRAFGPYDGWLRDAIVAFKYEGEWGRKDHLGACLAAALADLPSPRVIVPVPMHASRLRDRGYDQVALLAAAAAAITGDELVPALERTRATPRQVGLGADERRANVAGAFAVQHPVAIASKAVVLVDDVVTTGSTIGGCAEALRAAGAAVVLAASLAREL